ncbi:WD repeat-containing protein [Ceratobasidium sp. AG-Ba]|nr:WD repeat-containing protein [Ceratobasidium sp. AG-Ba]
MTGSRKPFKGVTHLLHKVFGDEKSSRGMSTPAQSGSSLQISNANLDPVGPESNEPAAELHIPPSPNPPATSTANPPSTIAPAETPVQTPWPKETTEATQAVVITPATTRATKYKGWDGLKRFVGVFSKTTDVSGAIAENRTEWQQVKSELYGLLEDLRKYIDASAPPIMTDAIKNLEMGIKREIDVIEVIQKRSEIHRYLDADQEVEEVLKCYRRIQGLFRRLSLNTNIETWKKLDELATHTYLKTLSNSEAAYYRSADSIKLNRTGCTENTRVYVLRDIYNWASGESLEKIYWLFGAAGTGKTTIAYSLCKRLEEEKMLAASFFCTRQLPECRNVNRIVPTIAYQLACYSSPFRHTISPCLQADPNMHNKPILDQFKELIVKPIKKVKDSLPTNLIIVIDALDECDVMTGAADILDILLTHASDLPLKFFVSGRPDGDIISRMRQTQGDHTNTRMRLHELESAIVQVDIRTYLKAELEPCMSISEAEIDTLVERSGVHFIYAATVVRYVLGASAVERMKRLEELLDVPAGDSNGGTKGIDSLYIFILSAAYDSEGLNDSDRAGMILVLHTIICVREPLSIDAIADLVRLDSQKVIQVILFRLFSVFRISETDAAVATLHKSFRDFIFNASHSSIFYCNAEEHNTRLAEMCFYQINKQVSFNICRLESSYVFDQDVCDLTERVDRAITIALFYACRHWEFHIRTSRSSENLVQKLLEFLSERLLLWMEIMNLKREFGHGIRMLFEMKEWLKVIDTTSMTTKELLEDSWRFMLKSSTSPLLLSTPHLYISALLLWPDISPIGARYHFIKSRIIGSTSTALKLQMSTSIHMMTNQGRVQCVANSPDGKHIAVALSDGTICRWDARSGQEVGVPLRGHSGLVNSIAYSHSGKYIFSGSCDKTVRIWDAKTGQEGAEPIRRHAGPVNSVACSPDGAFIVSGSDDKTIRVWNTETGQQVGMPFQGHTDSVNSVAYSPDGAYIISGSSDMSIKIWDVRTGERAGQPLQGHVGLVYAVAYSHDGAHIVSGSSDMTVRIWDAWTSQGVGMPLRGHTACVSSVAYSHDSAYIISGSWDQTVRIWDSKTGQQLGRPLEEHTNWVNSVAYSHDGVYTFSGSSDGTLRMWYAKTGQDVSRPLQGHTSFVYCVAYSHNSAYTASSSDDHTIRIWDTRTGQQIGMPFQGHTDAINSVAYSHDSSYLVSGSSDCTVRIWDPQTGQQVGIPLRGHTASVSSVAYSHDSANIVSGGFDETVRIWDTKTCQQVGMPLQGHTDSVTSVAYSHHSMHIVSGSWDMTLRIWDAKTGQQVGMPLQGHSGLVTSVAYSHDSAYIVSGASDETVRIWNAHTGQQVGQSLKGHTSRVLSVAYSHDSARIVSGSDDKTLRIWDAYTGQQIGQPLQGHTGPVSSVQYSHNSTEIISGSYDKTLRYWNADLFETKESENSLAHICTSSCQINGYHQSWVLREDGWIVLHTGERLIWVPSDLRPTLLSPQNRLIASSSHGVFNLQFDSCMFGTNWAQHFGPEQPSGLA